MRAPMNSMPVMLDARLLGRRVVVRYRRPRETDPTAPPLSDAVGELVAVDAGQLTVATRSGPVAIARADIVLSRVVEPSRRDVLALERLCQLSARPAELAELDGWRLSAGLDATRGSFASPLATSATPLPELLELVRRFYAERGLPATIRVPLPTRGRLDAELGRLGWRLDGASAVLSRPVPGRPADATAGAPAAGSPAAQPELVAPPTASGDGVRLARIRDDGAVTGWARGALDDGWLAIGPVEVSPERRGAGLADALVSALIGWASAAGARQAHIEVVYGDAPARATAERLGFTEHHRCHYRVGVSAG